MLKKDSRYFPLSAKVKPTRVNSSNAIYNPLDLKFLKDKMIDNLKTLVRYLFQNVYIWYDLFKVYILFKCL